MSHETAMFHWYAENTRIQGSGGGMATVADEFSPTPVEGQTQINAAEIRHENDNITWYDEQTQRAAKATNNRDHWRSCFYSEGAFHTWEHVLVGTPECSPVDGSFGP